MEIHTVNEDWAEQVDTKIAPPTSLEDVMATVPEGLVRTKQFVAVDVTQQVKSWLLAPESDSASRFAAPVRLQ